MYEVGDGSNISLWMDAWHPDGVLFDKYGFRVVYDACSKIDAKLSSVIKDGDWNWLPARFDDLVSIQSRLPFVKVGLKETALWLPSKNLKFFCKRNLGSFES